MKQQLGRRELKDGEREISRAKARQVELWKFLEGTYVLHTYLRRKQRKENFHIGRQGKSDPHGAN